jgi:transposase
MGNALRYQNRTGCQWELLPHDLPPTGAVRYSFDVWKRDGLDRRINEVLRMMVRERAGRHLDPSLVVLDSQSVRAAAGVPKATTGLDAAKKTPGRRRGLAVDVIGLIIAVVVVARPRPVPGTRSPDPAQAHRRHPRETQTPGQPRIPRRDRTRIVHTAPPPDTHYPRQPATLIKTREQNIRRLAYCPLSEPGGGCRRPWTNWRRRQRCRSPMPQQA